MAVGRSGRRIARKSCAQCPTLVRSISDDLLNTLRSRFQPHPRIGCRLYNRKEQFDGDRPAEPPARRASLGAPVAVMDVMVEFCSFCQHLHHWTLIAFVFDPLRLHTETKIRQFNFRQFVQIWRFTFECETPRSAQPCSNTRLPELPKAPSVSGAGYLTICFGRGSQ